MSVPKDGGQGRVNTAADSLAEVVANAAVVISTHIDPRPAGLASRIDVDVYLGPEVAERYRNAPDPHAAAAVLIEAGLCRDDVDTIDLSRLYTVVAPAPGTSLRDDLWAGGQ